MNFWDCVGEFVLFRWLFGNRNKSHNDEGPYPADTTDDTPRRGDIDDYIADDFDDDLRNMRDSDYGRYLSHNDYSDYGGYQSHDDFLDEQDDYDMMDDDF